MKLSLSLSDETARQLAACAQLVSGGNASLLTDVALKRFLQLPAEELSQLVLRHRIDRKAATRQGWCQAFWLVLGEELDRQDLIDNPYTPRNYGGFYVVLLLNHQDRYDDESDPFPIYIGSRMWTPQSPSPYQWTFDRCQSPVTAAETVAYKLLELGVAPEARRSSHA